jgi:hypothetical protein
MVGGGYGVDVDHGDEAEKQEQRKKAPFLARQILKWFYDTSTDTATRADHCGSLFEKGFDHLVVS